MTAKTKKLVLMSLLCSLSLGIFIIEAQIPAPVPIPGVKLGLANIITLTAIPLLGKKEAGVILALRIILGAVFAGSPSALIFSAAGGLLAYLTMCLTIGLFGESLLWAVSALAALSHNAGQLMACALIVKTPGILVYAPILAISGVITGVFTGIAAKYLLRALKRAG